MNEVSQLLKCNEFELFQLAASFDLSATQLDSSYRSLQRKYHPDNFIPASAQLLQLAQWINSAYATLKSPLRRSLCLLRLAGVELNLSHNTQLPMEFVQLQLELHEAIDLAKQTHDSVALDQVLVQLKLQQQQLHQQLSVVFASGVGSNINHAVELIKQLSFCDKLVDHVNDIIDHLF